VQKFVPDLYR